MNCFNDYDKKYPDLVILILNYFSSSNSIVASKDRSVSNFSEQYKVSGTNGYSYIYQPLIVDRICKKLCECGEMTCIRNDGGAGFDNNYIYFKKDANFLDKNKKKLSYYL